VFQNEIETLRCTISLFRLEKFRRAVYRQTTAALSGVKGERRARKEPPTMDVTTRSTSTQRMLRESLEDKQVTNVATKHEKIASSFKNMDMPEAEWIKIKLIYDFLEKPESIASNLAGKNYTSFSISDLSINGFIYHCERSISSTESNLAGASAQCLEVLERNKPILKKTPAFGKFLDARIPKPRRANELQYKLYLVEGLLSAQYSEELAENPGPTSVPAQILFDKLIQESEDDSVLVEATFGEVDRFMNIPRLASGIDVIQWWHEHRNDFPRLYRMATDYLAIPASSVPSECANSEARETFDDRERLH
jgi:hAT family C-terminal dimerisation region